MGDVGGDWSNRGTVGTVNQAVGEGEGIKSKMGRMTWPRGR